MVACIGIQVCWIVSGNYRDCLIFSKAINDKAASGDVEAGRDNAVVVNAARLCKGHDKGNVLDGV